MTLLKEYFQKKTWLDSENKIELQNYIFITQPEADDRKVENLDQKNLFEKICAFRGYFYGLLMAFCLSIALILVKMCKVLNGSEHAAIRYIIQLILMIVIGKFKKLDFFNYEWAIMKWLLARGVIGATTIILGMFAVLLLEPSDVSTLNNLTIITTAILARFILKEKLSLVHFLAALLSITGVIFVLRPAFIFTSTKIHIPVNISSTSTENIKKNDSSGNIMIGVILIIISTFLAGATNVIIKKLCDIKVCYLTLILFSFLFQFSF